MDCLVPLHVNIMISPSFSFSLSLNLYLSSPFSFFHSLFLSMFSLLLYLLSKVASLSVFFFFKCVINGRRVLFYCHIHYPFTEFLFKSICRSLFFPVINHLSSNDGCQFIMQDPHSLTSTFLPIYFPATIFSTSTHSCTVVE